MRRFIAIIIFTFCLIPMVGQASLVWRPGEGWTDESEVTLLAKNSREQLEIARKFEAAEDWNQARSTYAALVRKWPFSFNSGEAQYKMGWCGEKLADFGSAFKAYQKCIEKYPNSDYFEKALERQYAIANLYLAGEPQRIWKLPIMPSMEKTVEMYEQVIKNAPYGKYAPECQFKIGLAYERQRKWAEAIKSYTLILDRYPGNEITDDAQYQIGYAWMKAAKTSDYDQGAGEKAVDAFREFLTRFPNSEKIEQAKENLNALQTRATEGSFNIARFYESQKQVNAALIYYNDVIQKNPGAKEADVAREKIAKLTPLKEAGPPIPSNLAKYQPQSSSPSALPEEEESYEGPGERQIESDTLIGPELPAGFTPIPPTAANNDEPLLPVSSEDDITKPVPTASEVLDPDQWPDFDLDPNEQPVDSDVPRVDTNPDEAIGPQFPSPQP